MLKIHPNDLDSDVCQTSIDVLRNKVQLWLAARHPGEPVYFPDDQSALPLPQNDQPLNIVFFGGFLRRFLESGNWLHPGFRIWVLSRAVQNTLVKLLGFSQNQIGIIPRYELFGRQPETAPFILRRPTQWVFAGRLSATKNLTMLLATVSALQTRHQLPVELHLSGEFDEEIHEDRGRRERGGYHEHLIAFSTQLPWTKPPIFHAPAAPTDWIRKFRENPCFVSFSTSITEDFGVALAQAQEAGWPCLVSDWGGHRDAEGNNILKLPAPLIGNSHEPSELIRIKGSALAAWLVREQNLTGSSEPQTPNYPSPLTTPLTQVDLLRRAFITAQDGAPIEIQRSGPAAFADTEQGRVFYSRHRLAFSSSPPDSYVLVFVNDLHPTADSAQADLIALCSHAWEYYSTDQNQAVIYLSLREANTPEGELLLFKAKQLILPWFGANTQKILRAFASQLSLWPPLLACVPEGTTLQTQASLLAYSPAHLQMENPFHARKI